MGTNPTATMYRSQLTQFFAGRAAAGGSGGRPESRRSFSASGCVAAGRPSARRLRDRVDIPGLDPVTYADRMHYLPGLAKPASPRWERDYKDPRHYRAPPLHQMALNRDTPCHVFHQRTNMLEGVRQALWLTKSQLSSGFPRPLLAAAHAHTRHLPDLQQRVTDAIRHARFWSTTETRAARDTYSDVLLKNLLHVCAALQLSNATTSRRMFAEKHSLSASWRRGGDLFQIRGQNGLLLSSVDPLPQVSSKQEVLDTARHVLQTFYPVSPTIDLQKVHVYKEDVNCTGFRDDHAYPHGHTLYFLDGVGARCRLRPDQFRAKMIMFCFGNALARAHTQYGSSTQPLLDRPITIQAVGTNGRIFQFVVFQLNTTDLSGDDGVKNQLWLDEDVHLYNFAKVQPLIKKKQVKVPAGLTGFEPETFSKFLALYLNGAV